MMACAKPYALPVTLRKLADQLGPHVADGAAAHDFIDAAGDVGEGDSL